MMQRLKLGTLWVTGLMLAGCGGGANTTVLPSSAGTTSSTSTSGSSTQAFVTPASSVTTPTYTGTSLSIFQAINTVRQSVGVGLLSQNTNLDTAAQAHATYLATQSPPAETHTEVSGNTGFYAISPYARAALAGFTPASAWIDEAIGNASTCASQLLDTVYHAQELLGDIQEVGIGLNANWACVLDVATVAGTASLQLPSSGAGVPASGGQQIALGTVAVYPYNNETTVPAAMSAGENPAPPLPSGYSTPGHPIMVRVHVDSASDVLSVTNFAVSDSSGSPLTGAVLVNSDAVTASTMTVIADPNIAPGVVFFVPQSPLASQTTYTVVFGGARNGTAVQNTWSFTTQ
ncbi:MAG: hypothetical protein HKM02_04175 [Pseudomonadales bacterium]|nr:hypothetical protein [Pseudomonadales bacterium]